MATMTDREKLTLRMAEAEPEDLRLLVTRARNRLERSEAARELERRELRTSLGRGDHERHAEARLPEVGAGGWVA